ncbi:MAG: putative Ig domain-containing protein [Blastocatellales bacterium]
MNLRPITQAAAHAVLVAACLAGAGLFPTRPVTGQQTNPGALRGAAAIEQLKKDGQYESLQAAMDQARFSVSRAENTPLGRAAWRAPNRSAGYDAYVTEEGVSLVVGQDGILSHKEAAMVSLHLRGIGYGEALQAVAPGEVSGDKQTINITRGGGLREWFVNGADGLEHGFTLAEPLGARQKGAPLRLALQVSAGWRAVASDDGKLVTLRGANDQAIEYGKLVVRDKLGRNIFARLTGAGELVVIEVEDHDAEYPLTIDPLFTLQQRLLAEDGSAQDRLGWAVALDGDTAIIGAPYDDAPGADQGSAYIFARNGATWTQRQKLTADDGAAGDLFGLAVALDGDTAIIGAIYGPGAASPDQGAVYVFTRSGAMWTQRQKLTANDGASGELFGGSVALDGDTALVGSRVHRVGMTIGQGAAYVFVRSGAAPNASPNAGPNAGWTLQQQLIADDGGEVEQFGAAVALDGDTALIGAPNDTLNGKPGRGSAYIFTRAGATQPVWTQRQKLTDTQFPEDHDKFGSAVAISGDNILIGAPFRGSDDRGVAIAFIQIASDWKQTSSISEPANTANAQFGVSVAISGRAAVIGAAIGPSGPLPDRRSAYVALRFGIDWIPVLRISEGLGSANDRFGYAVALDGSTVLVGAPYGDAAGADQGVAYVFAARDSQHYEQQKLTAGDGRENDQFGAVMALDGDTLVVGAPLWDSGASQDTGAAYVFTRSGAAWTFQQQLIISHSNKNDRFGAAVALKGDTLAVGAPRADNGVSPGQGAVFIYTRNVAAPNVNWTLRQTLLAGDGESYDGFGAALALDGNTMLIGAPLDDVNGRRDQGSAYVFTRDGAGFWTQQTQLTTGNSRTDIWFGSAVALDENTAAVGAPRDELNGNRPDEGTVYWFTRFFGSWTRHKQFTATDPIARMHFGSSVAVIGSTLLVGAPETGNITPPIPYAGAVYAFVRYQQGWSQYQKITADDKAENALFGTAIAFNGDRLVVGAPGTGNGANARVGAAYVFTSSIGGRWTQQQKLTASAGSTNQFFGGSVALSNETVAVGAPDDSVGANVKLGSVYIFASPVCQDVTLAPAALPNAALNAAYSQSLSTSGGSGGSDGAYLFSVSGGALPPGLKLDQAGLLTGAPTVTGAYRFTISATQSDTLCAGNRDYTLTVTPPCPALTLAPATLPSGKRNAPFNQTLTASGGAAPYNYVLTAGALPPGLSLSASGALGGPPTEVGAYNFTITATDANGCTATRDYALTINTEVVTVVSAASFKPGVAPESIAAAFGLDLAPQTEAAAKVPLPTELGGVRVTIRDSQGVERLAPLFFVSPGQINFQVPQGAAPGAATINVSSGATGQLEIIRVAPALFTANADGRGAPAGYALHVGLDGTQRIEPIARFDGSRFVPLPIDFGPFPEQVYVVVYGTGFRDRQLVVANVGGQFTNVLFAGAAPGFVGLDQANVLVPRSLIGGGEVTLSLIVDGVYANFVSINVR